METGRWHRRKPATLRIRTDDEILHTQSRLAKPDGMVVRRFNERRQVVENGPERRLQAGEARGKKVLRLRKRTDQPADRLNFKHEGRPRWQAEQHQHQQQNLQQMSQELIVQFQQGVESGVIKAVGPWSPSPSHAKSRRLGAQSESVPPTPMSTKIYRINRELMQQFQQGLAAGSIKEVGPISPTTSGGEQSARRRSWSRRRSSGSRDLLQDFQACSGSQEAENVIKPEQAFLSEFSARTSCDDGFFERIPSNLMKMNPHGSASFRRCSSSSATAKLEPQSWCSYGQLSRWILLKVVQLVDPTFSSQHPRNKTQQKLLARWHCTLATAGIILAALTFAACHAAFGLGHFYFS